MKPFKVLRIVCPILVPWGLTNLGGAEWSGFALALGAVAYGLSLITRLLSGCEEEVEDQPPAMARHGHTWAHAGAH